MLEKRINLRKAFVCGMIFLGFFLLVSLHAHAIYFTGGATTTYIASSSDLANVSIGEFDHGSNGTVVVYSYYEPGSTWRWMARHGTGVPTPSYNLSTDNNWYNPSCNGGAGCVLDGYHFNDLENDPYDNLFDVRFFDVNTTAGNLNACTSTNTDISYCTSANGVTSQADILAGPSLSGLDQYKSDATTTIASGATTTA